MAIHESSTAVRQLSYVPLRTVDQITQFELAALVSLRNREAQIAEQVEAAEKSIRERLENGARVEAGERTAEIKENFRRSVSWRDVAERLAGKLYGQKRAEAYCENVLRNTKSTRTVSVQIF